MLPTPSQVSIEPGALHIDGEPGDTLYLSNSFVHGNLYSGIQLVQADVASVVENNISWNEVSGVRYELPVHGLSEVSNNLLSHNGYSGIYCKGNAREYAYHSIGPNTIEGILAGPLRGTYGIELHSADDVLTVEGNDISGFHQAGIFAENTTAPLGHDTVNDINFDGLRFDLSSSSRVRRCVVDECKNGAYCEGSSFPDLGTEADYGFNQILTGNEYWVANLNPGVNDTVKAEGNWWGVPDPNWYPEKWIGLVDYDPWLRNPPLGGAQAANSAPAPLVSKLGECRPNPLRDRSRISYSVAQEGSVLLRIRDVSGRVVRILQDGYLKPGYYSRSWDGLDATGRLVANGVYLYQLDAPGYRDVRKLVLVR